MSRPSENRNTSQVQAWRPRQVSANSCVASCSNGFRRGRLVDELVRNIRQRSMNVAAAAKRIAAKALHWKVVPSPRNIAESRHVLSILQGFGEVSTFKWLKVSFPLSPLL
jgi:hypothetical protein